MPKKSTTTGNYRCSFCGKNQEEVKNTVPSQDESHLNYDEVEKRFILTLKQRGPFGRSVYLSLSDDFEQ